MSSQAPHLSIHLPQWLPIFFERSKTQRYITDQEKMNLVLSLTKKNIQSQSGGPFGAAVFDESQGQIIALGVNRVLPESCSSAHAEIMALSLAQKSIKKYTLSNLNQSVSLVTSAQPCAMCFGAIIWSGVNRLVCGARGCDVEELLGFDEGPLHPKWLKEAKKRQIEVVQDVERQKAIELLKLYKQLDGIIYNSC